MPGKSRTSALYVIIFLGFFALAGLAGTVYLLINKVAGEAVALVSGMTGSAVTGLVGLLATTERDHPTNSGNQPDGE